MAIKLEPYAKSLEDELDWKLLDQLHGVVLQISSFCFETKKFCVTTEFVVLTLLAKFTVDKLDHSLFVSALAIPLAFWFLDAIAYYYQAKIRGTMSLIQERIKSRNSQQIDDADSKPETARNRITVSILRVFRAAANNSMWLYALLVVADLAVWTLFTKGVIK